ncbi:MAG: cytidylate kinase-like family protein [Chloroflexi bacterium]|nr:cytidylate kinase-like family protein [Chloroflexota bacterium]
MPVITINGPIGCGAVTIGQMVAEELKLNFVDRMIFTEAARIVGTPVGALIAKEQRVDRFRDRLGRFVQTMLERSAMSGVSGEPYFGRGIENLPPETYMDLTGEGGGVTQKVDDKTFIEAMTKVVKDIHKQGNAVIIGRGANQILADAPQTLHVGLLAPLEVRVETLIAREHFEREEAEIHVVELERAREDFVQKFWKVHPNEASHYHMMLNMGKMTTKTAAEVITRAAGDLTS